MAKEILKDIHQMVHTMSKSEKRNFKLYAKRSYSADKELMYLQLFDVLEKAKNYSERKIYAKLEGFTPHQVSDLKGQLFKHILRSLRLLYRTKPEFKIKEVIEFAHILYQKRFFHLSLEQLQKAKNLSKTHEFSTLLLQALELEKKIESRHVTRSHSATAQRLTSEIEAVRLRIRLQTEWSDLSLMLYDHFLKTGHVKNQEQHEELKQFFIDFKPRIDEEENRTYYAQLHRVKAYVWYYYIVQDFKLSYKYCLEWLELIDGASHISDLDLFEKLKAYHECLSNLYYCKDAKRHDLFFNQLSGYIEENSPKFDLNTHQMAFLYQESARLNNYMLRGDFSSAAAHIQRISDELTSEALNVDLHKIMVFKYKFASVHFALGENRKCVRFLADIINLSDSSLREDVQCFARILNLVAHFELDNDDHLFYIVKSVYRFLLKMKNLQKVQKEFVRFLKRSVYMDRNDMMPDFIELRENLLEIQKDPFEIRPFLYLDIISWLDSKIQNIPIGQAVVNNIQKD